MHASQFAYPEAAFDDFVGGKHHIELASCSSRDFIEKFVCLAAAEAVNALDAQPGTKFLELVSPIR